MPYKDKAKRLECQRRRYRENPEYRQKIYDRRNKRVESGLCRYCLEKAVPGFQFCLKHIYLHRASIKRFHLNHRESEIKRVHERRLRLKAERKCINCGMPLIEDEGVKCTNCAMTGNGLLARGGISETSIFQLTR